jgi:uncharacterized RDD family membrane protein YckC
MKTLSMNSEEKTRSSLRLAPPGRLRVTSFILAAAMAVSPFVPAFGQTTEPGPAEPPAAEEPATKPLSPEAQQALIDDTNKAPATAETNDNGNRQEDQDWRPPMVVIGHNAEVKPGERVEALVVVGGNAKVRGKVRGPAVVIGGDLSVSGQIGDAAVAVLGSITAHRNGRIRGDAVAVGGTVNVEEGAHVRSPQGVELPDITWMRNWFLQCVLLMRPLSLKVKWVWFIAGIFLLLYLLIGTLFPRPVRACVNELTAKPATTFCLGLLTLLLAPLALVILGVTGIGLLVVPFVLAALIFGAMIGRVAVLEWIGLRLAHQFGAQNLNSPVTGLLLGTVVIAALYLVPFVGLITFAIIGLWSLGGAVTAAFGSLRREMPEKPKPEPVIAPGVPAFAGVAAAAPAMEPTPAFAVPAAEPPPTTPIHPPVLPEILTYPKASFWERLAAAFLDTILVIILCVILHPIAPVVALAYFSGLWAWRGTTIGGIVVGLKVVRADGKPLTFPVTLVRSLAAAFSIVVLFLGYLWIAWDPEKQGWHDKIAGTMVLRLPKGTPLVCL